jgi:tRNA(fMet)-specific endonuclease VapC
MILLDTDHLSVLKYGEGDRCARLLGRLTAVPGETVGTTIISVEEQMRGWLAAIARERRVERQVTAYRELGRLFDFFGRFAIGQFDDAAAARCTLLRSERPRLGVMDLKIAAIALMNDALLLTANRRDFGQIPGLRFDNWLD